MKPFQKVWWHLGSCYIKPTFLKRSLQKTNISKNTGVSAKLRSLWKVNFVLIKIVFVLTLVFDRMFSMEMLNFQSQHFQVKNGTTSFPEKT